MSGKKIAKDVLLAAEISVFYVSSVFLSKMITDAFGIAAAFIYILFISALYGLALISDDKIEWLVKLEILKKLKSINFLKMLIGKKFMKKRLSHPKLLKLIIICIYLINPNILLMKII